MFFNNIIFIINIIGINVYNYIIICVIFLWILLDNFPSAARTNSNIV